MKNCIILFVLLGSVLGLVVNYNLIAQTAPTLSSTSFWRAGASFTMAYPSSGTGGTASVGSPGANRSWDLRNLNLSDYGLYERNLANAAGNPFAANYPNANLVVDYGTGSYDFCKVNQSGVFFQGYRYGANEYLVHGGDGFPEFLSGLSFNDSITTTITSSFMSPDSPILQSMTYNYKVVYDAWGVMTLPGNRVFNRVVRQKITTDVNADHHYVFVNADNGEIIAYFLVNDGFPGLWELSRTAIPGTTSRQDAWAYGTVRVYPNPIQEVLTVQVPGMASADTIELAMVNIMGQVLSFESLPAAELLHLPVGELPSGLYHLRIRTGNMETSVKVVKQ